MRTLRRPAVQPAIQRGINRDANPDIDAFEAIAAADLEITKSEVRL